MRSPMKHICYILLTLLSLLIFFNPQIFAAEYTELILQVKDPLKRGLCVRGEINGEYIDPKLYNFIFDEDLHTWKFDGLPPYENIILYIYEGSDCDGLPIKSITVELLPGIINMVFIDNLNDICYPGNSHIEIGKVWEWNNNYGDFRAVDVREINEVTYAFCATSKGLAVFSIHHETTGQNITKADVLFISFVPLGYCTDIIIEESGGFEKDFYAYITVRDKGLYIRNVTNPAFSYYVGSCDTPGYAQGVAIATIGSVEYAFVADGDSGLQIINISDPTEPRIVGSCDTPGYAQEVAIATIGSVEYAFVADGGSGLQVIDISDPTRPMIVGNCNTPGYAQGVAIAAIGSVYYAFVVDGYRGLQVIDISDPTRPIITGTCDTPGYAQGVAIATIGSVDYAFIADRTSGLVIIDISDPNSPVIIGLCNTSGYAQDVAIFGGYIFIADGPDGIKIIDITNASEPVIVGKYDISCHIRGMAISGDYAFVACGYNLLIIDISDKNAPKLVGSCMTTNYIYKIAISGDYAFIANGERGLLVVDISNPCKPVITGSCDTPCIACGVYITGDYAFVTDGECGIQVIDISDPNAPVIIGSCDTPGNACEIIISGTYAFVEDVEYGIHIIDISDPNGPFIVGSFDIPGYVYKIFLSGNYVFVLDQSGMLYIIDISDISGPWIVTSYDLSCLAEDIFISGNYIYVACRDKGLLVLYMDDKNAPVLVGKHDIPYIPNSVLVYDGYVYVTCEDNGLLIFKINKGSSPKGNLILVAGGANDYNDPYWEATQALANEVFNSFITQGYEFFEIFYFNPAPIQDTDNDGIPDQFVVDDPTPTGEELKDAVIKWASDQVAHTGPLYIYLIGHGAEDRFQVMPNEVITAHDLREAIDKFRNGYTDNEGACHPGTNRQVVVIMESASSGTFIDDLSGPEVTVITSTDGGASCIKPDFSDPNHISYKSFTSAFMDALAPSLDPKNIPEGPPETLSTRINDLLKEAFITARDQLRQWAFSSQPFAYQAPQMALPEATFTSLSFSGEGIIPINHLTIDSFQDIPYGLSIIGYDPDNTPIHISGDMAFFSSDPTILDPENTQDIRIIPDPNGLGINLYSISPKKNGRISLIAYPAEETDPHHLLSARITIDVTINDPNNIMLDESNEIIVNAPPKEQTLYNEYANWSYFYGKEGCIYEIYAQDTSEYGYFIQLALYDPNIRPIQSNGHYLTGNNYIAFPCARSGYYLLRVTLPSSYPPEGVEYILSVIQPSCCHEVPFEMNLPAGWGMISLPVIPNSLVLSDLFPEAVVVYSYKKESGYVRIKKGEELVAGKGYWMLFIDAQKLVFTGEPIHEHQLSFFQDGWDMIGGCTYPARASADDSCTIDVIYKYIPALGYQRLFASDYIEPGKGYWILCGDVSIYEDCQIRIKVEYP